MPSDVEDCSTHYFFPLVKELFKSDDKHVVCKHSRRQNTHTHKISKYLKNSLRLSLTHPKRPGTFDILPLPPLCPY